MIHVVQASNAHRYEAEIEEMYRQRARIFRDKLSWDVHVDADGRERDRYDDLDPVYLLYLDDRDGTLLGSVRLMPTTGPTLMRDVFGDSVPADYDLENATIWECTRFAADEDRLKARPDGPNALRVACEMLFAIGEIGIPAGIETVVANFVPAMLLVYRRAGCHVDVLGRTDRHSVPVFMGAQEVSPRVLGAMRAKLGIEGSLIDVSNGWAPARKDALVA